MTEWATVKSLVAHSGGPTAFWCQRAKLRLTPDAITALVNRVLLQFEAVLKARFSKWEEFPADAQLGMLSMSWAMGPNFHYPAFASAVIAGDWETAREECYMPDQHNAGLRPRNVDDRILFGNALVIQQQLDYEKTMGVATPKYDAAKLYYPLNLALAA
jgi:hypothetical protein